MVNMDSSSHCLEIKREREKKKRVIQNMYYEKSPINKGYIFENNQIINSFVQIKSSLFFSIKNNINNYFSIWLIVFS
jgi:hypothetical protein